LKKEVLVINYTCTVSMVVMSKSSGFCGHQMSCVSKISTLVWYVTDSVPKCISMLDACDLLLLL
jgi:hypothetical protein